jgi:hypothetical protein
MSAIIEALGGVGVCVVGYLKCAEECVNIIGNFTGKFQK